MTERAEPTNASCSTSQLVTRNAGTDQDGRVWTIVWTQCCKGNRREVNDGEPYHPLVCPDVSVLPRLRIISFTGTIPLYMCG